MNDYTTVYEGFETAQEAVADYNERYIKIYGAKSEVVYNGIVDYSCETGKFKAYKLKNTK